MPTIDELIETAATDLAHVEEAQTREAGRIAASLSDDVRDTWESVARNLTYARAVSGTAASKLRELSARVADPTEEGDKRALQAQMDAIREKAKVDIAKPLDAANAVIADVLPKLLTYHALPRIEDPAERSEAINEVTMLLQGASGSSLIDAMRRLADGGDRRHVAVVTSTWGKARLGGDHVVHHGLEMTALNRSLKHGTLEERAHASAFGSATQPGSLTNAALKALAATRARANTRLR